MPAMIISSPSSASFQSGACSPTTSTNHNSSNTSINRFPSASTASASQFAASSRVSVSPSHQSYFNSPSPFAAPTRSNNVVVLADSASPPARHAHSHSHSHSHYFYRPHHSPHHRSLLSQGVEELRAALKKHSVAGTSQDPVSGPSGDHSRGCMSAGPDTLGGGSRLSLDNNNNNANVNVNVNANVNANVSGAIANNSNPSQPQPPPPTSKTEQLPITTSAVATTTSISPADIKGKRQLADTVEVTAPSSSVDTSVDTSAVTATTTQAGISEYDGESEQSRLKRLRPPVPAVKLLPRRYELVHPNDLVILISSMIMELIQYNDTIPLQGGKLTRFHSRTPPRISVHDYLQRLTVHATLSPPILLSMVYYIDRLCALYPAFTVSSLTVHRFLITSATVASKGLSDSFWTNKTYARVGGITISELALLELDFLWRVEWQIVPQPEVLVDYYLSLVERCEGYALEPEELSPQTQTPGEPSLLQTT